MKKFVVILKGCMFLCALSSISYSSTVYKIGHRGACGHAPENTLVSFEKAVALGVDAIELDVHCCKTGELVVIHDSTLNRTTNGSGLVSEKSLSELKMLDAGSGQKIPTLREVIEFIHKKVVINIELKQLATACAVAQLINEFCQKGWKYDDFLISSFDHYALQEFSRHCPYAKTGALIAAIPIGYAEFAQKAGAAYAIICSEFINREFVDDAHARGLQVYVYTVDDHEEIHQLITLGVDGIISNYPDRLCM